VQFFPVGFTACQHTANGGNNDTDAGDASDNYPPDVIANLRRDQAVEKGANDAYNAGRRAKENAYPQDGHGEDEQFAERPPIIEIEFHEVDEEESC